MARSPLFRSSVSVLASMLAFPLVLGVGVLRSEGRTYGQGDLCFHALHLTPDQLAGIHFSPEEDLRAIDVDMIDRATQSLDIAMYAFTDKVIRKALARAASRGVKIFLYRDKTQIKDRNDQTQRLIDDSPPGSVAVKIKDNSSWNIMHLKAYLVDGRWIREGSANWSPSGEGAYCTGDRREHREQQDNDLVLSDDPVAAKAFFRDFVRLWQRSGNLTISAIREE